MGVKRKTDLFYPCLEMQLCLMGWNYEQLAAETGMNCTSIRRKLHGNSPMKLSEAKLIRDVIQRAYSPDKKISLDKLFSKQGPAGMYSQDGKEAEKQDADSETEPDSAQERGDTDE